MMCSRANRRYDDMLKTTSFPERCCNSVYVISWKTFNVKYLKEVHIVLSSETGSEQETQPGCSFWACLCVRFKEFTDKRLQFSL